MQHSKKTYLLAAIILATLVSGMFWRVLFLGETLVDAATLQNQLPWGATGPTFLDHSYNRRDITDTYITREYFLVDSFKRGEWPMWSPYNLGGHPIYADGVFRMLSPFNLLYLFFDVPRGYDLTCLIQLFCCGYFAYLYFARIRLRPWAALIGAVTFMFASLTLFHVTSSGWLGGLMWLPLIFLGIDRAVAERSIRWAVFAGMCFAMQFFCGYMANAIYYLGAIVTYYGFRVPGSGFRVWIRSWVTRQAEKGKNGFHGEAEPGTRNPEPGTLFRLFTTTLVTGFALAAVQWLPIFELLGYSNRKIVPTELAPNWLPPWYLGTAVLPHVFGEPYDPKFAVLFVGIGVSHAHSVFFGISALVLVGFAWLLWWHRKTAGLLDEAARLRLGYFWFLAGLSTFVMCAVPLYVHITKYIPVLQTIRVTNRVSVLFTFSLATLAAMGAHYLLEANEPLVERFWVWLKRGAGLVLAGTLTLCVLVSALAQTNWYQHLMDTFDQQKRIIRAPLALSENFDCTNLDYFPATIIPLFFIGAVFWLVWRWKAQKIKGETLLATLLLVLSVELMWIGANLNESHDRSLVYHPSKATTLLQSDPDLFRVMVAPANFSTKGQVSQLNKIIAPPNTLVPYRIQTMSGKDQLFPRWFRDMSAAVHPQNYLSHVVFNNLSSPWYDLWNVKYILTNDDLRVGDEGYVERYVGEGIRIYENTRALPRAFFIPRAVAMPETPLKRKQDKTPDEVVKRIKAHDFNPLETAYVQGVGASGEISYRKSAGDFVRVDEYRNNLVRISANSVTGGVLVLSDTFYPGWNVYVDNAKTEIWRADQALRAVKLPPGQHQVEFRFEPIRLRIGAWVSVLAAILLGGWGLIGWFRRS